MRDGFLCAIHGTRAVVKIGGNASEEAKALRCGLRINVSAVCRYAEAAAGLVCFAERANNIGVLAGQQRF